MTSPPMRRHDLLRWADTQLAQGRSTPAATALATDAPRAPRALDAPDAPDAWPETVFAPEPIRPRRRQRPALPPLLRWASRIDAWPPALWMSLQALALWPVLSWALRRLAGEAAPLQGLLPLALLAMAAARGRLSCDWPARTGWLAASAVLSLAVTATVGVLAWPTLATAAALAAGCSWAAFRKPGTPVLPVFGLLVLSLPLEIPGLRHLFRAEGLFVLPVWLLWLGFCAACAAALWNRLSELRFLARLPAVALAAAMACLMHLCVLLNWEIATRQSTDNASPAANTVLTLFSSVAVCAMVLGLMRPQAKRGAP